MQGAHLLILQEGEEQLQQKGFLSFWSNRRYEHARVLICLYYRRERSSYNRRDSSPSGPTGATRICRVLIC
jgi:hypothetical protein